MKIVVSPAKSLNFEDKLPTTRATQPQFLEQADKLNSKLSNISKKEIQDLMHISEKLADLNYQRYQEFTTPFTKDNARPAVYAFDGDVYTGLDAYTIPAKKLDRLQDTLRILSGLYGILRPLDLMQAYRLEMGTNLEYYNTKNLYEFWGNTLTDTLNKELKDDELFVNLASQEYFKAVKPKELKVPVITPIFKDFKNGKLKIVAFFAKKARGAMVRYIIDNDVDSIDGLKGFDYGGYGYSEEHSNEAKHEYVFTR